MSEHRNPDPLIADLLELLNAAESFQEIEELLKQSLSRRPETSIMPVEGENRFAARQNLALGHGKPRVGRIMSVFVRLATDSSLTR